jgi:hypothetical protein
LSAGARCDDCVYLIVASIADRALLISASDRPDLARTSKP